MSLQKENSHLLSLNNITCKANNFIRLTVATAIKKNGRGLGRVYPPLDTSDFMDNHFEEVICLMKHGKKGELIVNGKNFNKRMNGLSALTDLEIAEIGTYIYNTWNHQRNLIDVKEVTEVLSRCGKAD